MKFYFPDERKDKETGMTFIKNDPKTGKPIVKRI